MRGKPTILSREDRSKKRVARKGKAESTFRTGALPKNPPADLRDMPAAQKAWRSILRAHDQLPGQIFNELDRDFLIGYCMAVQARAKALDLEQSAAKKWLAGELALSALLSVRVELRQTIRLVSDLEKQVYATPKSRGGVSPAPREATPEEVIAAEMRDLDKLLGDDQ